jgi:NitT/TauT family transport system permease protein
MSTKVSSSLVAAPHRRDRHSLRLSRSLIAPAMFLVAGLLIEYIVRHFGIASYILPAPSAIITRLVQDLVTGELLPHIALTLSEVLVGFAFALVCGVAIGTAVALSPIVEATVMPLLLAIQTIPKIAIAPLFLIWFGFGMPAKAVTAGLLGFYPILINVIAGLKSVDERRLLLMRGLRASSLQTFTKARLPSMLPLLFAGMETGIVFAVLGALVGEFISASEGLGAVVLQRQASMDVAGVFSALICLSLMSMTLNYIVRATKRYIVFW